MIKNAVSEVINYDEHKVLGLIWLPKIDMLKLNIPNMELQNVTKRFVLHILGRIFDPLGLVDPVKLKLKYLLNKSFEMDAMLDDHSVQVVKTFLEDLSLSKGIQIPKHFPGKQ